jgi:thioredoxin reductase (NADPH)
MKSKCVIIGAGPSGIACAIQLMRHGLKPVLFEKQAVGGLVRNANLIENYPGFPQGIRGTKLVKLLETHLQKLDIQPFFECVRKCYWRDNRFVIMTDKREISSFFLVIASGTDPNKDIGCFLQDTLKETLLYEAYPIQHVRGKKIAIIGSGDAAFDYALNLSKKNSITLLNRNTDIKCLSVLWDRSLTKKRIDYYPNCSVREIQRQSDHFILKIWNEEQQCEWELEIDFVIIAVGREPCVNFLDTFFWKNSDRLEKTGRLYFIGDVHNGLYRQTAICCGEGIRAAMEINRTLLKDPCA